MKRAYPYGVSAAMLALVVWPALRTPPRDSFPLSTYPMFSHGRRDPAALVERAVAVTADGRSRPVPPRLVGSDEVLQARALIARTVAQGGAPARALCRDIAARLAPAPAFSDVVSLELRTDTFDAVAFFSGREDPIRSKLHARCKVPSP